MRLVLLPIVYNAMGAKESLRRHPLFLAIDREMRRSTYWPLVNHPPSGPTGPPHGNREVRCFFLI